MAKLTLKQLEEHQDETLTTLQKELDQAWKEANTAMAKVDTITRTIAKFQTQILMAGTAWKLPNNN